MKNDDMLHLNDQELLAEAKKLKSFAMFNNFLIGFVVGILLYVIFHSAYGFYMLIPVFLIKAFVIDPRDKRYKAVKALTKERGLK